MRARSPALASALVFAMGLGCGGDKAATSSNPSASSAAQDVPMPAEARAVYDQIVTSQRAGFERNDIGAYMAMWHPDATLVMSLSPTPDADYLRMNRAQVDATRRVRFCRNPGVYEMRFELADAQMDDDDLIIDVTTGDTKGQEKVVERYTMRKHEGQWRILENRYWIESLAGGEGILELNAAHYAQAHRDIAGIAADDPRSAFDVAMAAILWVEAADFGSRALKADPALATDEAFLGAYSVALLFNGDAIAAVKVLERKLDMSDAEAQALIDGYCEL